MFNVLSTKFVFASLFPKKSDSLPLKTIYLDLEYNFELTGVRIYYKIWTVRKITSCFDIFFFLFRLIFFTFLSDNRLKRNFCLFRKTWIFFLRIGESLLDLFHDLTFRIKVFEKDFNK